MANFDASAAVTMVWQRQGVWSQAAGAERRRVVRARRTVAGLTVGAAVAGSLATQLGDPHRTVSRCLAILAAAALLLVPVAARWTSRESVHAWTRLRSVSEALKADVHRYLAGVAPFGGADRDRVLLRRADTLLDDAGDLVGRTVGVAPVVRPLPDIRDVPSYLAGRVRRQVEGYYAPTAKRMARLAARVRYAATAVTVAGALLAATVGVLGDGLGLTAWLGVAATVTTALVGYSAAQQYEHQQIEFARTADQLTRLCVTRESGQGWTDDDAFVAEAERIISLSNEGWMAKMIEEDGAAQQ
ncbi:DUF4231 domain-containing protein [Micromonospora sp. NPDC047548]|uniref:DUF4231 domain-containing protein n=1 Tax=Micromonospora sp. NPDC047548 TaxID=3155624 RepID=UPI0033E42D71